MDLLVSSARQSNYWVIPPGVDKYSFFLSNTPFPYILTIKGCEIPVFSPLLKRQISDVKINCRSILKVLWHAQLNPRTSRISATSTLCSPSYKIAGSYLCNCFMQNEIKTLFMLRHLLSCFSLHLPHFSVHSDSHLQLLCTKQKANESTTGLDIHVWVQLVFRPIFPMEYLFAMVKNVSKPCSSFLLSVLSVMYIAWWHQ